MFLYLVVGPFYCFLHWLFYLHVFSKLECTGHSGLPVKILWTTCILSKVSVQIQTTIHSTCEVYFKLCDKQVVYSSVTAAEQSAVLLWLSLHVINCLIVLMSSDSSYENKVVTCYKLTTKVQSDYNGSATVKNPWNC